MSNKFFPTLMLGVLLGGIGVRLLTAPPYGEFQIRQDGSPWTQFYEGCKGTIDYIYKKKFAVVTWTCPSDHYITRTHINPDLVTLSYLEKVK